MRRILSLALCLLLAMPFGASALYYVNRQPLTLVGEPEDFSPEIAVFRGEEQLDQADLTWVEGRTGKALLLPGDGTFLRVDSQVTRVTQFTFSAWINWQGGESNQRLFTIARGTQNYFTFSPNMRDEARGINGVYMGYQSGGTGGKTLDLFNRIEGDESYAMPRDQWHHVAVVSDNASFKVYLDGVLWLQDKLFANVNGIAANSLDIGGGVWGDPSLHALLDDVVIYPSALSAGRVRALVGEREPAYLPTEPEPTATTATEPIPTETEPTALVTEVRTLTPTLFGIPVWAVGVIGGIILTYIVVTVIANLAQKRREEKGDEEE